MYNRVMISLFTMSVVGLVWTDANAGCTKCAPICPKQCASWIPSSAKCLASIADDLFDVGATGRCEVGGTVPEPEGPPCGPIGTTGELRPCGIRGVISCANQAPPPELLSSTSDDDDSDDDDGAEGFRRFKTERTVVSDSEFDATGPLNCDGNDCRWTHELDLSEGSGEAACNAKALQGFDTFTPKTGWFKTESSGGGFRTVLIERCTTETNVCGQPYSCLVVQTFQFPDGGS